MTDQFRALAQLLDETGAAHHQAYIETDGYDPEWPLWYADYLQAPMAALLDKPFTKSELVYAMVLLSKEQPEVAPDEPWSEYYARYFLERQG